MIRGSSWECGWCGDFGSLQRTPAKKSQNTAQITLTLSFVYHVDLPETWSDLKKALRQIAPNDTSLSQLLGKVLLHHISAGIQHAGALPDEKKAEELRTFLHNTLDLNLGENAEEVMRDAKRGVLFCEEAALSETDCGTFWTELLATRPVEDYYNHVDPDGLFELFSELSSAYAYFGGKKDEEMGEAQDYQNALEEAYNTHWQNKVLLHPDVERAKRLLAQGKFPDYEDICREILLVEYPEEVPHETAEDFDELSWERVLDDVFTRDSEKGMEMWRRLLDIAEPSLKTDAKTAEKLLPDWDWLDSPTDDQALPLLVALDDERFVSQLFESAYLDRLQFHVLEICRDCGEETLARHCMDLALKNPCLEEQWRKRYTQVLAAAPSSKRTKPPARALARPPVSTPAKPAGESYYQFCNVQFKEDGAAYAYLTGGISLKAGDFVVVPIGDHQAEKLARVTEVFVCSTQNAPYPPEKAKFVLRKSERTAFPERTKPQHPAPKQAAVPAPTESRRAVPPVQSAPTANPQKSAPTVQSAITPPIVSQTPTEPEITEKKSTLSKKPFPLGKIIAAVLAVAVIAWVSISVSDRNKQRAAAYDAALQELSNGNYTSAEQGFSALSGYRDAASLSVYCKYADMYKDRTDYAGGQDELSNITLQYDTSWQQDVDALETRVKGYKAEKDAAEEAERQRIAAENAAKREQSLKDQYSGKLPVEGMPVSCLKYTSLGEPDKRLNCKNFEKLEQNQKYFNVYWYDGNGEMIAAGMCAQWRDDSEFMLKTFSQYYPSGSNKGQTFHYGNGDNNSGSIRDDYDNPEDLWEDNPDWYEDEDEAWDEWENG
ncbi:hypothetical protein [Dysosmobacter sp.]|uniref:hypothetical protein n=1 Tax=Dysosmobacter sp. TaxID=2591382 RepID=UPI00307BD1AD